MKRECTMKKRMWRAAVGAIAAIGITLPGSPAPAQQKTEISLSRQPGIFYMPSHIMEKQKLIEKHAASLGVPGVTTKWINLSGGGAQTDALLAGGARNLQKRKISPPDTPPPVKLSVGLLIG